MTMRSLPPTPWLISFALLVLPVAVRAATVEGFQYYADLPDSLKPNQLYQVPLSPDLLKQCRIDCTDLRVLDLEGREIPYVILKNAFSPEPAKTYDLTIKNYASETDSATLTLELPKQHEPIEQLDLDITGRDFTKRATVYGSDNGRDWRRLAEDAVYDFSSQVDLRKTSISFEKTDHRFYRLKLTDEPASKDPGRSIRLTYDGLDFTANDVKAKKLKINRVLGSTRSGKAKPDVFDEALFKEFRSSRDEKGKTILLLEAGLPFEKIEFTIAGPSYYYRNVQIYSSETGKEDSFRMLTQGVIYRFPLGRSDQERSFIEHSSGRHLFYRIVLDNGDNPPLEVSAVKFRWVRRNLYFVAISGEGPYRLYLGNAGLERPNYDLVKFIRPDNWFEQRFDEIAPGPVKKNSGYQPGGDKIDRARVEKIVLVSVMVVLAAGLTFWLYALLKRSGT
jgi:hypothetical protein